MELILTPGANPVTIQRIYDLGIIDAGLDTARITALLAVGLELVQNHTGVALLTQTRQCVLSRDATLPTSPVQSLTSLVHTDLSTGLQTTLVQDTDYRVNSTEQPTRIVLLSGAYTLPTSQLTCTYVCGYTTSSLVPNLYLQGITQYVLDNYENPSAGLTASTYALIMQGAIYRAW